MKNNIRGKYFRHPQLRDFIQPHPQCWLPAYPTSWVPLVHAERRKSSNKMPNHGYLIAGTLTFSSSYLMVVFICQTNVRNTIPQAQSLWQHRQLLLLSPHLPTPSLPPSLPHTVSSKQHVCNTTAITQTMIQGRTVRLNPKGDRGIGRRPKCAPETSLEFDESEGTHFK